MTSLSLDGNIHSTLQYTPIVRPHGRIVVNWSISFISFKDVSDIVLIIDKYRAEYIQKAQEHPDKTVFIRPRDNPLAHRAIQFCANGSIYIHFNRDGQDSDFKKVGPYKKVHAAMRVDLPVTEVFMVATRKLQDEQPLLAQRNQEIKDRLSGQEGVVKYFDNYTVTNNDVRKSYSFMQFYNKTDLFSFHQNTCAVNLREASFWNKCEIALDILRGLNTLCVNEIVHRNINFENIVLNVDSIFIKQAQDVISARIGSLDFAVSQDNVGNEHIGDPIYMAPEVCRDPSLYSHASDCWAAGISIAQIFSETIPWKGESAVDAMDTISNLEKNPFPVSHHFSIHQLPIRYLLDELCERDPKKRINGKDALAKYEFILLTGDLSQLNYENVESLIQMNPKAFNGINKLFHKMVRTKPLSFNFRTSRVTLEEFKSVLQRYTNIESITLPENANDNYLMLIKEHCPQLKSLILSYCNHITDSGLEYLSTMTSIELLDISECFEITNAGMDSLSSMTSLKDLNISGCGALTDDALASISDLILMKKLNMRECQNISAEGLRNLSNMNLLECLDISQCDDMTIEGLYIAEEQFPKLQEFFVSGCPEIEDDELEQFLEDTPIAHVYTTETVTLATLDGMDYSAYL